MQADKQYGAKGKKVVNDDSIIHCGMNVQRRMHEAHLQVWAPLSICQMGGRQSV